MRKLRNSHTWSYTILLTALFLLLSFAAMATPAMAAQDNDWQTLETDHFIIEYQSGYEEDAQKIGRMGERARTELLAEIPVDGPPTLKNPVHIRVYPEEQWNRHAGTQYWHAKGPVRIYMQAPSEAENVTIDDYERALWAEYANIILWDSGTDNAEYDYYDRNPSWLHEGLSDYYVFRSPSVKDSFPRYSIRAVNKSIRSGETGFDDITQHQYGGGHLLSMYMVDTYGEDAVWRMHKSPKDFWPAVQSEFGVNKTEFVDKWQKWSASHIRTDDTQDNDWQTLETDHFIIEYQSGYEEDAQKIGRMGERARTELLAEIPVDGPPTLKNPVHIRVYPEEQWNRHAGTQYWHAKGPVRIHLQAPSEAENITIDTYERAFWHEYTNIILWDTGTDNAEYDYYDRNPGWLHEGLSDYYVFQSPSVKDSFPSYSMRMINQSIQSGEMDFDEITQKEHEHAGGHLLSMYMVDTYGEDAVWRMHKSPKDFWPAVQSEFGVNKTEFVDK